MSRWLAVLGFIGGCGNDVEGQMDAPPGSPVVVVSLPIANQAFYPSETPSIRWSVYDEGARPICDVTAFDGTNRIAIKLDLEAWFGLAMATPWRLIDVPPSETYVAEVRCTDETSLIGLGRSAMFAVAGPPQPVSYASQIQPIWKASCVGFACHDNNLPQAGLGLSETISYANLVGRSGTRCGTLVSPGDPNGSYLLSKLRGSGPCMDGGRMPKGAPALPAAQLQLIRDWIFNGAPNN